MIPIVVEISGEAPELAAAEAVAAAEVLGGRATPGMREEREGLVAVDVPDRAAASSLAARLGLARRVLAPLGRAGEVVDRLREEGRTGRSAAVRRLGRPSSGERDAGVRCAGAAYVDGGGRIDLEAPARRFWLAAPDALGDRLFEEVGAVDRRSTGARRMTSLPFQRPVSLAPRFARALANLARVRSGDRVVDPFVGTGALLAEAALLGARIFGCDRDPQMVRGALRNFSHLGVSAEALAVGDAGRVELGAPGATFDALLTDPPYGRSSSTGREGDAVIERVLPRWADRVRPGGRVVVVVPRPIAPPGPGWESRLAVPVRVHRSLTREFRVFERSGPTARPA